MSARRADDRERLAGVVAAPVAALIDFVVVGVLAARDRSAQLGVAVTRYEELEVVLLVVAVGILASAVGRRRVPLGAALGLQGLALFDLRFWGFAIPFVAAGAWLVARAYRSPAPAPAPEPEGPGTPGPSGADRSGPVSANKRFTPRRG